MGKGRRRPSGLLQVPLSARDDEETIAKQWAALREAFLSDRQVHHRDETDALAVTFRRVVTLSKCASHTLRSFNGACLGAAQGFSAQGFSLPRRTSAVFSARASLATGVSYDSVQHNYRLVSICSNSVPNPRRVSAVHVQRKDWPCGVSLSKTRCSCST